MIMWKNNKDSRAINEEVSLRVVCPHCKHKNMIPVFLDERLCYWCKRKVKNNTKAYFKYKIRQMQKEMRNED